MPLDVICFGEALVDLLPNVRGRLRDCERFEVHSGGAPSNVAVGLARLGRKVAFCGVVGDDEFGHLLARKLTAEGVATHFRFTSEAKTGMWFVALDAHGDRTFFTPTGATSADKRIRSDDLPDALLRQSTWLHVGSSAHVSPEAQAALRDAVERARALGVKVSFDPNLRVHLWREVSELQALVRSIFPRCALVKLAADEIELCLGTRDPAIAARELVGMGVEMACITLGAEGALVRRGAQVHQVPAPRVEVVDTTGAGDGFVAGLLTALLEPAPALELGAAARYACRVGARVCTQLGAVAGLPRRSEMPPEAS
jgi:fructokinase